jgi:hypothetical protein
MPPHLPDRPPRIAGGSAFLVLLRIAGLALAGCSSTHTPRLLTPAPVFPAIIRPLDGNLATVLQVHERLRFVVLDYSLSAMPPSGTSLEVYRGSRRIGRVRLSRWSGPATAAADFVEGVPQVGDIVRTD